MKRVARVLAGTLAAILLAVAAGTLLPRPLFKDASADAGGTRHILVLTNPIHTDIAIPIDDVVREEFAFLGQDGMAIDLPGAKYLVFGWGGRAFYLETATWADLKPMPLLKGLTLDRSVMHVDLAGDLPEHHPDISGYDLAEAEFQRLLGFVRGSFSEAANGPMPIPDASYGDYDRFYEANGYFTAILGCNTWAAKALRTAGMRTGWWNPLPQTLRYSLDLYN